MTDSEIIKKCLDLIPVGSMNAYRNHMPENLPKDIEHLLDESRNYAIAFDLLIDIADDLEKSGVPVEAQETYKKILKFLEYPDKS